MHQNMLFCNEFHFSCKKDLLNYTGVYRGGMKKVSKNMET